MHARISWLLNKVVDMVDEEQARQEAVRKAGGLSAYRWAQGSKWALQLVNWTQVGKQVLHLVKFVAWVVWGVLDLLANSIEGLWNRLPCGPAIIRGGGDWS